MSPSDREPDIDPQGTWDPQGSWNPQDLWQAQNKELDPVTLAHIHAQALSFERTVRRRNTNDYVACAFTIGVAVAAAVFSPHGTPLTRAAVAVMALGMAFVAWQVHRRTSPTATPPVGDALVDAYRRELIRQRDAGCTGLWWYVLPMIIGPVAVIVALWIDAYSAGRPLQRLYLPTLGFTLAIVIAIGWMMFLIRAGVRRLQKMIDDLG